MKCLIYLTIISCLFTSLICLKSNLKQDNFNTMFQVQHLKRGDGQTYPQQGDKVKVHYVGTFPNSGKKFDSSRDRGQPFSFSLGEHQVITCWDQVVARLSLGERVKVICPSRLAYGERGAGSDIPPNTDIAFDIEMLGINN